MKIKVSIIFTFLVLQLTFFGQEIDCDSISTKIQNDKDSLPRFDLFMKDRIYGVSFNSSYDNNFSLGVGYYFYSFSGRYRKIPLPGIETNLNYHFDGYLFHNLSIQIPFLITPALNLATYTDFNKTSVFLRPGIGINAFIINFNYNFNWLESDELGIATKHNFSLYFRLGIFKNVWGGTEDIYQSQYDRWKIRKNK